MKYEEMCECWESVCNQFTIALYKDTFTLLAPLQSATHFRQLREEHVVWLYEMDEMYNNTGRNIIQLWNIEVD